MVRLGQRLQDERKKRKLTLEEVAATTKIRLEYLLAIEKGDYSKLPSPAYVQGFVSNYASYLGFPKRETIALFRREYDEHKAYRVLPKGLSQEDSLRHRTFRMRKTSLVIIGISIFLIVYLVFQYRTVIIGPDLSVSYPKSGSRVGQTIEVKGSTDPTAVVTVNGYIVSVEPDGSFIKSVVLLPGKSQIEISAKSRYGKISTIERTVFVAP